VGSVITIIIGIVKAVPIIDKWLEQLMHAYFLYKVSIMEKENVEAIRKLIEERDQRDFEKAIGSKKPGEPSGDDGAVIIDRPPGM